MRLKKLLFVLMALVATVACSQQPKEQSKPIVKVNEYTISEDAFRTRMASVAYYRGMGALSLEDKKDLVDQEIKKELLIQEAMRLGLDKDDSFRQAIEKYWEQTLITTVVKQKMEAIQKNTIVTAEEVNKAYQEMAKSDANCPPLEKVSSSIEKKILEDKKTEGLNAWTEELRKKAKIFVHEDNLANLR